MRVVQLIAAVGLLLLATTAVHASLPPSGSAKLRNTADCNGYDCIDAGLPLTVPATDAGRSLLAPGTFPDFKRMQLNLFLRIYYYITLNQQL
jgi:hypothetical protein